MLMKEFFHAIIVEDVLLATSAGAGIYVGRGVLIGPLPNNGIVNSRPSTIRSYFIFNCRSDSMMNNVGVLIGPNEIALTTGDVFRILHYRPGELIVSSRNDLTTSDQGVYTCRIPLQSGEMREINVGLYSSGFTSKCFIPHE